MPGRKSTFTLSRDELRALSAHAVMRSFAKNTVIVNEGDPADSLYVIVSGKVKAFVADGEGREVVLSTQGLGEYFGDRADVQDKRLHAFGGEARERAI